jgi:hypothetical protein
MPGWYIFVTKDTWSNVKKRSAWGAFIDTDLRWLERESIWKYYIESEFTVLVWAVGLERVNR